MPSLSRPARKISIVWLIPAFVVSALIGAYLAITLITANLPGWGQWLRDFAQSPGAAGFAALIAATIAFSGILRQVAVSRDALAHQRDASQAGAWWAMFEWASDRAIPPRNEDQPLPTSVTIRTLETLADDASSSVQEAACAGVIDILTKRIDTATFESLQDDADAAPSERDDPAFAALASYVESSRGTPAASAIAEALVYENEVLKALISLSREDPTVKIFRNPSSRPDRGADAIAEVDGQRVIIEIKFRRNAEGLPGLALKTISRLRAHVAHTDPLLLITPFPSPLRPERESALRAVGTQWREPRDNAALLNDLRRASLLDNSV